MSAHKSSHIGLQCLCLGYAVCALAEQRQTATGIVGLSCTFPGAAAVGNVIGFWHDNVHAVDHPIEIPYSRWDIELLYSPAVQGKGILSNSLMHADTHYVVYHANAVGAINVRFASFIDGIDRFDAALFRYRSLDHVSMFSTI